jgi:hypothetical protein
MSTPGPGWLRGAIRRSALALALTSFVFVAVCGWLMMLVPLAAWEAERGITAERPDAMMWAFAFFMAIVTVLFGFGMLRALGWALDPYSHPDIERMRARGRPDELGPRIGLDTFRGTTVGPLRVGREWFVFRYPLGLTTHVGHLEDVVGIERTWRRNMGPALTLHLANGDQLLLTARTHETRDAMAAAIAARAPHATYDPDVETEPNRLGGRRKQARPPVSSRRGNAPSINRAGGDP